ncbi:uncharacterized protein Dana_GF26987 [Drosophila ananassae]|uniref:Uncharacterized protein n=2 Tax=Drosophila ananassae TaxID=7217 RepID=A0A0P8ZV09_DROAN|nr:uncharacterized protein Dana_GF26987 [Drosophila ananassae]
MSRSLINEGRSRKKSCLCLFVGITVGIFLAGILHYSIVQSDTYGFGSKKFKRIIRHDVSKNVSVIPSLKTESPVKTLEVALPSTVLPETTTKIAEEVTNENSSTDSTQNPVKKSDEEETTVPSSSTLDESTTEVLKDYNETLVQ